MKTVFEVRLVGASMTEVIQRYPMGSKVIAHFYGGLHGTGEENANLFVDAFIERENKYNKSLQDKCKSLKAKLLKSRDRQ